MPKKGQKAGRITDDERALVIKTYLADPKKSTTQIGVETGVSQRSVARIVKEDLANLARSGESGVIARIIENDKRILEKGTRLVQRIIDNAEQELDDPNMNPMMKPRTAALSRIASALTDSTKRHQLLTGQATENIQALENLNDEQRERILRRRCSRTVGEGEPD